MQQLILGGICGDIIGSIYEFKEMKNEDFPLFLDYNFFTDDSAMTVATMDCLLEGEQDYYYYYKKYFRLYPDKGYGGWFRSWARARLSEPYNSFGNGSAMRVGPVGWAFDTLEETLNEAQKSAGVTHNHPEGIKGAQAIASAVFLGRQGHTKQQIKQYIESTFGYNLDRTCAEIRPSYRFDETCQGSVPEAIIAFIESTSYESAVRLAVSLGGDSDTLACMTGSIAEAFYGNIPAEITNQVLQLLPEQMMDVIEKFSNKYCTK